MYTRKDVAKSMAVGIGTGWAMGFIVGTALGLGIGFLFAPRPGRETRQLLMEKAEATKVK
ncbi:MAG: YtxH domain-containing protein [Chloroflexota bacterium]